MDFRRIEIIFLVVFLALDVFLLTSFHNSQQVISNATTGVNSTITDMKKRNITFGKLDKKPGTAYYLGAQSSNDLANNESKLHNQDLEYNQTSYKLISTLEEPISVKSSDRKAKLDKFKKKESNILFGSEYTYAPQLSSSTEIVYAETGPLGAM